MTHPFDGRTWLRGPLECCTPWELAFGTQCITHIERKLINMGKSLESDDSVSCGGRSLIEMIEDLLDNTFDQLMSPDGLEEPELAKGYAQGLSTALAVLKNPYFPNVDVIKSEAVERYEARQGVE